MTPKFFSCIPIMTISDIVQAREFYINKLGFKLDFEWGNPTGYIGLFRDEVSLHLINSTNSRQKAGTGNISFITSEVDSYFQQCLDCQVEIIVPPENREYGLRDFSVKDPDGNILNFGCDIDTKN